MCSGKMNVLKDQKSQVKIGTSLKIATWLAIGVIAVGIIKTVSGYPAKKVRMEEQRKAAEMERMNSEINEIKARILDVKRIERGEKIMDEYLRKMSEPDFYTCCVKMLAHPNPDARITAMLYLGFGGDGTLALLCARLLFDTDADVRLAVPLVLGARANQEMMEFRDANGGDNDTSTSGELEHSNTAAAFAEIIKCLKDQGESETMILCYQMLFREGMYSSFDIALGDTEQ